jgi:hypothetical protein
MRSILLDGILGHQRPFHPLGISAQYRLEGASHGSLMINIKVAVLTKDGVIVLNELVGGFAIKIEHGYLDSLQRSSIFADSNP